MLFLEKGKKIVVWGIGRIGSKVIKKWGESYHICFAIDEKAESVSLEYLGYRVYDYITSRKVQKIELK